MGLWKDLRYAARVLAKNPGFTAVAVITLALGIGANSAVFSVFDQVILQLLPVENPRELVLLEIEGPQTTGMAMADNNRTVHSYPQYVDFRDRNQVFSGVIARTYAPLVFAQGGEGDRATGDLVSGNFFDVLGVKAHRGRLLTEEDDRVEGANPVAVISYDFWRQRLGGREDIIGQPITVNGVPLEIVGVVSPEFHGLLSGDDRDLYVPISMRKQIRPAVDANGHLPDRLKRSFNVLARLKPGVTIEQAGAAMEAVWSGIQHDELAEFGARIHDQEEFLSRKMKLTPALQGIHTLRDQIEEPLLSVLTLVGLVLLIACVNVAGLLMARAVARGRELAIRVAIGASRWVLARQMMLESLLLAGLGGAAGLLVAYWTMQLLDTVVDAAALDGRIIGFNFALALVTAVVFGLAPSWQAVRAEVAPALKDQSSGAGAARRHARFRQATVVVQVSLSMLLLVAAGLFAKTLHNLMTFDPGFRTEKRLSFALDPKLSGYDTERGRVFYEQLRIRLGQLPGVRSVGAAELPVMGNADKASGLRVEGYEAAEGEEVGTRRNAVSPGYFRTMGIPVVLGREFNERDRDGARKVAVVNEAFVDRYYKGQNPIGKKITFGRRDDPFDIEIVGVVKNQKTASLREPTRHITYTPCQQEEGLPNMTFYLWSDRDEASLGPAVRRVVRELDRDLPIFRMQTVEARREEVLELERTVALLSAGFALLATLLASIGLYGLMAYGVARRIREIGVRMALGAQPGHVLGIVMREAMRYLAIGLAIGIPAALGLGRYLESQLFGMKASDPLVLIAAAVSLTLAVLLAAFVPARRAARVNPVIALRYE